MVEAVFIGSLEAEDNVVIMAVVVLFIGLDDVVVFEVYGIGLLVVFDDVVWFICVEIVVLLSGFILVVFGTGLVVVFVTVEVVAVEDDVLTELILFYEIWAILM